MQVQLYKIDATNEILATLSSSHTIGRGSLLQCNDKRVSREHAEIKIMDNKASLTSIHINPCFVKLASENSVSILSKDNTVELNDGDRFALLPDLFWYGIKKIDSNKNQLKRGYNEEIVHDEKRIKHEVMQDENTNEETEASVSITHDEKEGVGKLEIEPSELALPLEASGVESGEFSEIKENFSSSETHNENYENNSQTTLDKKSKEKHLPHASKKTPCRYGSSCYRKNAEHRATFSHPEDNDNVNDSEDSRPSCSYGVNCYRKNISHRQQYKHIPDRPVNNIEKNTRLRKPTIEKQATIFNEETEDEEDPFACDDEESDDEWI